MSASGFAGLLAPLARLSSAVGGIKRQLPYLYLAFFFFFFTLGFLSAKASLETLPFCSFRQSYLKSFHMFKGEPGRGRTKKASFSLLPSRSPMVGLLLYMLVLYQLLLLC